MDAIAYRLGVFVGAVILVAATNFALGVYQRGIVGTALPGGLRALYTWLLLFGLASFSAVILHFELRNPKNGFACGTVDALLESFMTNTSMLSRGMVLNLGALGYATVRELRVYGARISPRFIVLSATGLFSCSFAPCCWLTLGGQRSHHLCRRNWSAGAQGGATRDTGCNTAISGSMGRDRRRNGCIQLPA